MILADFLLAAIYIWWESSPPILAFSVRYLQWIPPKQLTDGPNKVTFLRQKWEPLLQQDTGKTRGALHSVIIFSQIIRNGIKLFQKIFRLAFRKKFFFKGLSSTGTGHPGKEAVTTLEVFKRHIDVVLTCWFSGKFASAGFIIIITIIKVFSNQMIL